MITMNQYVKFFLSYSTNIFLNKIHTPSSLIKQKCQNNFEYFPTLFNLNYINNLFINVPLDEVLDICVEKLYNLGKLSISKNDFGKL